MTDEELETHSAQVYKSLEPFLALIFGMSREEALAPLCHCLVITLCHGCETIPDAYAGLDTLVAQIKTLIKWNFASIHNQKPDDAAFPYFLTNPSHASPEVLEAIERKAREYTEDQNPVAVVPCK